MSDQDTFGMFVLQLKQPFNPISHELWNDVITRAGAIIVQMDLSHPEADCIRSKAQK